MAGIETSVSTAYKDWYSELIGEGGVGASGQHIDRRPQIWIAKSKLAAPSVHRYLA